MAMLNLNLSMLRANLGVAVGVGRKGRLAGLPGRLGDWSHLRQKSTLDGNIMSFWPAKKKYVLPNGRSEKPAHQLEPDSVPPPLTPELELTPTPESTSTSKSASTVASKPTRLGTSYKPKNRGRAPPARPPEWQIQKDAITKKLKGAEWCPNKRVSPDAMECIRELHNQYPAAMTTPVLAREFQVSPEAIRRILRRKWTTSAADETDRRDRWRRRGERIWSVYAMNGYKPPKSWRDRLTETGVLQPGEIRRGHLPHSGPQPQPQPQPQPARQSGDRQAREQPDGQAESGPGRVVPPTPPSPLGRGTEPRVPLNRVFGPRRDRVPTWVG